MHDSLAQFLRLVRFWNGFWATKLYLDIRLENGCRKGAYDRGYLQCICGSHPSLSKTLYWSKVKIMAKAEYKEGPEARENFEKLAKAVFSKPNTKPPKKRKERQPKATAHKKHGSGKG